MKMRSFLAGVLVPVCLLAGCAAGTGGQGADSSDVPLSEPVSGGVSEAASEADASEAEVDEEESGLEPLYGEGMEGFCYESAALALGSEKANSNYSPVGLYLALAMTVNGASQEVLETVLPVLGAQSLEQMNQDCAMLAERLQDREDGVLEISNSIWLQNELSFTPGFSGAVEEHYNGELFSVDFKSGQADVLGAQWAAEASQGMVVPQMEAKEDTVLRVINSIYFNSPWSREFYPELVEEAPFTLDGGDEVTVDMMHEKRFDDTYVQGDNFRAIHKAQPDGYMRFVLPDEGVSVDDFLSDGAALSHAMLGGEETDADIELGVPKYTFENSFDLTSMLEPMGLGVLKEPFAEPLSNLAVLGDGQDGLGVDIVVTDVLQDTFISVDEKEVEAAAVTQVIGAIALPFVAKEPLPYVEIILDRPFLYGVFSQDGTPLFMGVVRNPLGEM